MEVVEDEENGHVREFVNQESGQDARFRLVLLPQEVRETALAETGEERREIPQERGIRRAFMNLEPIDVRPRPLTDEPARDDGALSDARDAGHDEHADLGGGPRVERLLLVGPPEHASESAERVSPEDRRNRTRTDSMETREVEPPSADERYGGGEVHVGGENLWDLRNPHRRRVEAWGKDFHDVSLETAPEFRRFDPALVGQTIHGLPDSMARHVGPFSGDEARGFHARQPFRGGRSARMRGRRNALLRDRAQRPGLTRGR